MSTEDLEPLEYPAQIPGSLGKKWERGVGPGVCAQFPKHLGPYTPLHPWNSDRNFRGLGSVDLQKHCNQFFPASFHQYDGKVLPNFCCFNRKNWHDCVDQMQLLSSNRTSPLQFFSHIVAMATVNNIEILQRQITLQSEQKLIQL